MIVGRVEHGQIQLVSALPQDWEGQAVKIEPCVPADALPDLRRRLAVLHALGPMEYEPGEQAQIARALADMNELSRTQIQHLADDLR
ncbi:MAG: hypothetical protein WD872_07340 [Pirellulaceae bacterium]